MTYLNRDIHKQAVLIAEELHDARESARAAIAKLFPVDALVLVGAEAGRSFTMRVTRHGNSWSDVTTVYGVNVATGPTG